MRPRRLLLLAFALSLAVHAIIALRVNWPFERPRDEPQIVSLEHRPRVVSISKMPTPPPRTPQPAATPRATIAPIHSIARSTKAIGTRGVLASPPSAAPTLAPTPVLTRAPASGSCTNPDAPAAVASAPTPPAIAPAVRANATNATIRIQVKLDERGNVTDATVAQGSGNGSLDLVALAMAKSAQYTPAYRACKAIAGTYTFSARFVSW